MTAARRLMPAVLCLLTHSACGQPLEGGLIDVIVDTSTSDVSSDPPETGPALDIGFDSATADTPTTEGCDSEARAFNCPCGSNDDCAGGFCVEGPDGRICTRSCTSDCPLGFDCTQLGGSGDPVFVCNPRHVTLCRPCLGDRDCGDGVCLPAADPDEGRFCATPCGEDAACPDGYTCESGADGGTTRGLCVPSEGATCECRPSWVERDFEKTCMVRGVGPLVEAACAGTRSCGPEGLTACSASPPTPEVCDSVDNDCDAAVDEDLPPAPCQLSTEGIASTCPGESRCVSGETVCLGTPRARDLCDGVDNDCSGGKDDGDARLANCAAVGCRQNDDQLTYTTQTSPACAGGACAYTTASCGYFACDTAARACLGACATQTDCIATAACIDGTCGCPEGYAGPTCQECATFYQDNNDDGTCQPACRADTCNPQGGVCDDRSGAALCQCDAGYLGETCDQCDASLTPGYTDPEGDGSCNPRGPVVLTASPVSSARVGFQWRFRPTATQTGAMPGDEITWAIVENPVPSRIVWTAATSALAWTPTAEDVTWAPDLADARSPHRLVLRATAVDGQTLDVALEVDVYPALTITATHPAAGSATGGEELLVFGSGFVEPIGGADGTGPLGLRFGGLTSELDAPRVTVVNPGLLRVTTPAATAATRHLTVMAGGAASAASPANLPNGFTHLPVVTKGPTTARTLEDLLTANDLGASGFDVTSAHNVLAAPSSGGSTRRLSATGDTPPSFALSRSASEADLTTGAAFLVINGLRSSPFPLRMTGTSLPARLAVTGAKAALTAGSIVLVGCGFTGLSPAEIKVRFAGAASEVSPTAVNAAGTELTVPVPADARTGPVRLAATGRDAATSSVPVVIEGSEPVLSVAWLTPELGRRGSVVVIAGSGFKEAEVDRHRVTFDGQPARVLSAEVDRLVVVVPDTAVFGPNLVAVTVDPARSGETVEAGVYGVAGTRETLVTSAASTVASPLDGDAPLGKPLASNVVHAHPSGLVIVPEPSALRAFNATAAPVTAFGKLWPPNAFGTLRTGGGASAMTTDANTGDLFIALSSRVVRLAFGSGAETAVTGKLTVGGSAPVVLAADATFNGISDLKYLPQHGVLLIADDQNTALRALNLQGPGILRGAWGVDLQRGNVHLLQKYGTGNPAAIAVDGSDAIYLSNFQAVRKIAFGRTFTSAEASLSTDTELIFHAQSDTGVRDGAQDPDLTQPRLTLRFNASGLALDPRTGDLFVGSRGGVIRRVISSGGFSAGVTPSDPIALFAGHWPEAATVPVTGHGGDGGDPLAASLARSANVVMGPDGDLLVAGSGLLRRITRHADGRGAVITTIAGALPSTLDGQSAVSVGAIVGGASVLVDVPRNALYLIGSNRVLRLDLATGRLHTLAGTGVLGNSPPGTLARAAHLGTISSLSFDGPDHLLIAETVLPRITRLSLLASDATRVLERFVGDGQAATAAEADTSTPHDIARATINTGLPGLIRRDDGLVFFGNENVVRVVNPTDAPLTAFGRTFAPRAVWRLSQSVGSNIAGLHLDARGDLWVAALTSNSVARVDAVTGAVAWPVPASVDPGFMAGGRLRDLRLNQPAAIATDFAGNLYLGALQNSAVLMVRARDGVIDGDCLVAPVFGNGGDLNGSGSALPAAYGLNAVRQITLDGTDVIINAHSRVWRTIPPP